MKILSIRNLISIFTTFEGIFGFLMGIFLLIGRWTPGRLFGTGRVELVYQPRLWIGVIIVILSIIIISSKHRICFSQEDYSFRSNTLFYTYMILVFLLYVIATVFWSRDVEMGAEKVNEIALLFFVLVAFYGALYVSEGETIRRAFWTATLMFSIVFGVLAIQGADDSTRAKVLGGGANVFGRNMGFFLIACLYFMEAGFSKLILTVLMSLAGMLTIASGSRGAMLSLIAAGIAYLWLKRKGIKPLLKLLSVLMLAGILFYCFASYTAIGQKTMSVIDRRIIKLTIEQQNTSGRVERYSDALDLGYHAPLFGSGLRAYSVSGLGSYPHNIFLEVFDEGGAVGVFILFLALSLFAIHVLRFRSKIDGPTMAAAVLMAAATQLSGDLYDCRALFLFMLLCVVPVLLRRPTNAMPV